MGQGIGEVLPFAVGIAISPIPIIAVVLMLFSRRASINGPMFLLGWVGGLTILSIVVYATAGFVGGSSSTDSPTWAAWLKITLGVFLVVQAWRKRRASRGADGQEEMPHWMAGIDEISPGRALRLGALLSSVNPKNLALAIGGIAGLAQDQLPRNETIVALAVFILVASSSVGGAVVYHRVGGESAKTRLGELRTWMGAHNTAIMGVLFVVFGVVLISNGISTL